MSIDPTNTSAAPKRKVPLNDPGNVDPRQDGVTAVAKRKISPDSTMPLALLIAESDEGRLAKAKSLYRQNKFKEALQSLEGSFINTKIPLSVKTTYHNFKGDCFSELKDHESAIQNYVIAENLEHDFRAKSELFYKIARSRKALGQSDFALEMINKALATKSLSILQKNRFEAFKAEIDPKELLKPEAFHFAELATPTDCPPLFPILGEMQFSDVGFLRDDSMALRDSLLHYEALKPVELTTAVAKQTQDTLASASTKSPTVNPKPTRREFETNSTLADNSAQAFQKPGNYVPAIKTYELTSGPKENSVKKTEQVYRKADGKPALKKEEQPAPQQPGSTDAATIANSSLLKGIARLHLHEFQEAIVCFNEGLKIANLANVPNLSAQLFHQLGSAYYQQGNLTDCTAAWEKCLPLVKDNLQLRVQIICSLASAYVQADRSVHAEMLLQKAIEAEFSGSEKGTLILYLAELFLKKKEYLKTCKLLLTALEEDSTFSHEINLQFCNMLIRVSRETNDDALYQKIKDIGMGFTTTTIETKINFLFESALMEEAQGYDSEAMEIYQLLLTQNLAADIALTIGDRIAELAKKK